MQVKQVYDIANAVTKEILGANALTIDDMTNLVDVGKAVFDATSVDNYIRKLVDHIGRVIFVNRPYSGRSPSVLMESWEFGAILEKIDMGIPDAEENPMWKLEDGQVYEQDKFTAPKDITVKFYKDRTTFQVSMSFAEDQIKSSFDNITQLNAFFSMIYTRIDTSFTIKLDGLIMLTIDNFAATIFDKGSAVNKVNLLALYKAEYPESAVTAATALTDLDFLKYAAYMIKLTSNRLTNAQTCFNIGKRVRFTPVDMQKIIMLDMFAEAANVFLQSDTFHNEFVKLPNADKVSFWQGSGGDYSFDNVSQIHIKAKIDDGSVKEVTVTGLLAMIFDRDAVAVNCLNRRVTSHYNAPGEFINYWYKMDAQYFNDFNENGVIFYIAD